jgi:hypothetical protein
VLKYGHLREQETEMLGGFRNLVLEKDGNDQLRRSSKVKQTELL